MTQLHVRDVVEALSKAQALYDVVLTASDNSNPMALALNEEVRTAMAEDNMRLRRLIRIINYQMGDG